jgi:hypothetical protein
LRQTRLPFIPCVPTDALKEVVKPAHRISLRPVREVGSLMPVDCRNRSLNMPPALRLGQTSSAAWFVRRGSTTGVTGQVTRTSRDAPVGSPDCTRPI